MAITDRDVLHVAALARLGVDPHRLPSLVSELNGILEHMKVLDAVDAGSQMSGVGGRTTATASRWDAKGTSVPLAHPRESFAPEMRDGFFLVPRLATHEGEGERSP